MTSIERKANERKRDKKLGIRQLVVKCHDDDREAIRKYADNKLKNRLRD